MLTSWRYVRLFMQQSTDLGRSLPSLIGVGHGLYASSTFTRAVPRRLGMLVPNMGGRFSMIGQYLPWGTNGGNA